MWCASLLVLCVAQDESPPPQCMMRGPSRRACITEYWRKQNAQTQTKGKRRKPTEPTEPAEIRSKAAETAPSTALRQPSSAFKVGPMRWLMAIAMPCKSSRGRELQFTQSDIAHFGGPKFHIFINIYDQNTSCLEPEYSSLPHVHISHQPGYMSALVPSESNAYVYIHLLPSTSTKKHV